MKTMTMPQVGDKVSVKFHGRPAFVGVVVSMTPVSATNAGGVTVENDAGTGFSWAPTRWVDAVLSGKVRKV